MTGIKVIEVPFNSSGSTDGVARMPAALSAAGLYDALPTYTSVRITVASPVTGRGPSGLLAESSLIAMTTNLADDVGQAIAGGTWPLVIGGDCAVLLGALAGAKRAFENVGLMFVDGHEDAWPPGLSTTGEAADCDLGLALGWYEMPGSLKDLGPLVSPANMIALGPRDEQELNEAGIGSIRNRIRMVAGADLARSDATEIGSAHGRDLRERSGPWWLHVDLDVLSTASLPAVDYPQPGGIDWNQLTDLTGSATKAGGCIGASVVIYNPDLDRGANAPRIVSYLADLTAPL